MARAGRKLEKLPLLVGRHKIAHRRLMSPEYVRPVRSPGGTPFFKKFPAPLRREFCCKPLNSLADWVRKSAQGARILQNSLFFSLLAGSFEVETGSILIAASDDCTNV